MFNTLSGNSVGQYTAQNNKFPSHPNRYVITDERHALKKYLGLYKAESPTVPFNVVIPAY